VRTTKMIEGFELLVEEEKDLLLPRTPKRHLGSTFAACARIR
jgi:hypothetical protein